MKSRTWSACLACLALGFVLSCIAQPQLTGQVRVEGDGRMKWEYKVESNLDSNGLNEHGAQGWDLVAVVPAGSTGSSRVVFLKRAKL